MKVIVSGVMNLTNGKHGFKIGFDSDKEALDHKAIFEQILRLGGYEVESSNGYHEDNVERVGCIDGRFLD